MNDWRKAATAYNIANVLSQSTEVDLDLDVVYITEVREEGPLRDSGDHRIGLVARELEAFIASDEGSAALALLRAARKQILLHSATDGHKWHPDWVLRGDGLFITNWEAKFDGLHPKKWDDDVTLSPKEAVGAWCEHYVRAPAGFMAWLHGELDAIAAPALRATEHLSFTEHTEQEAPVDPKTGYKIIRCGKYFELVVMVCPADAGPESEDAKFFLYRHQAGLSEPATFAETDRRSALCYFGGMADSFGSEVVPKKIFPSLAAAEEFVRPKHYKSS